MLGVKFFIGRGEVVELFDFDFDRKTRVIKINLLHIITGLVLFGWGLKTIKNN